MWTDPSTTPQVQSEAKRHRIVEYLKLVTRNVQRVISKIHLEMRLILKTINSPITFMF